MDARRLVLVWLGYIISVNWTGLHC